MEASSASEVVRSLTENRAADRRLATRFFASVFATYAVIGVALYALAAHLF